jgi:hypothetical protein
MKKLSVLILSIILVGSAFLTSCSKSSSTTVNGPSVHFLAGAGYISADQSVALSAPLKFGIAATQGDGKLKRFFVQRTFQGHTATVKDSAFSATSFNADLYTAAQAIAGQEVWVFTIFDNNGGSAAVTLTITTTPGYGAVTTYSMKVMGAQTNSSDGSSFASSNGTVYSLVDAKTNSSLIDWVYFYGATNLACLCAPSETDAATVFSNPGNGVATWSTRNITLFKKVTATYNWTNITNDSAIVIETSGITLKELPNLAVNDLLAFTTAAGKKGMIRVNALTVGASGSMTIDVKVQP